jgi:1-deoxy-D-xylulose-5-phosphate reductoisomerase
LEGKKPVRIILTASGGPFLDREELESVTPEEALSHPTWSMGRRITIDSATLMNKGFEVIEAVWLFGVDPDQIEVVIHPQSILHSAVEFSDGTVMGCMSVADMRLPISYALKYPERAERLVKRLDLTEVGRLTFEKPDFVRFPCLSLSYSAIEAGGTMPTVLNAADEVAIDGFLEKKIPFSEIPSIIERTMEKHRPKQNPELCDILSADKWAREVAQKIMASMR